MAKILIVEDNEMNMRLFSDLLKTKGHQITECLEGTKAVALAEEIKPDLILMDIQLPEVSGVALQQQIRTIPSIAKTRIVAVSAFAMKGDAEKLLKTGFDDYLSKPVSIPLFFETVEKNLAASKTASK